jgi:hypothetical protein
MWYFDPNCVSRGDETPGRGVNCVFRGGAAFKRTDTVLVKCLARRPQTSPPFPEFGGPQRRSGIFRYSVFTA